ncbi:DUF3990 domain-containing protein, partial [Pseudoalteromonas sp. SMS1]|uniref:DUF3990 domain-containing protein n=1 Tax=Pseudoalteromonas sp. SMS1 TaxID=2908894 RepID=UPI001F363531
NGAGYNDAFVSHRAFDDYSSLVLARTGLEENFGSAWSSSATGRGLNLAFMHAQSESIRNTLSTPITESAAYISGNRRGYVNASIGREGILASYRYQKASMSQFIAQNQAQYDYEQANPMGGWGDVVWGMGQGFIDSVYQDVQFLGTSVAAFSPIVQGVSHLSGRGTLNPFDLQYHSLLDTPKSRMQAAGRFMGKSASAVVAPGGVALKGARRPDEVIVYYHGSRADKVDDIRKEGVNLVYSKSDNDFGRGFYMTTSRRDAFESAEMMGQNQPKALVRFEVPKKEITRLNNLKFSGATDEWQDFVKFNKPKHVKLSYVPPTEWLPTEAVADIITGPLFRGSRVDGSLRHWVHRADQTSIHTDKAVSVFNRYMVR